MNRTGGALAAGCGAHVVLGGAQPVCRHGENSHLRAESLFSPP